MIDEGLKRKRAVGSQQDSPAAKKPALDTTNQFSKANPEETRGLVRSLYVTYQELIGPSRGTSKDAPAFHAILQASQGNVASRRLAARLIPRFIAQFPEQVHVAAVALTGLHSQHPTSEDAEVKHLEDVTRQDALSGLTAILQAAQCCKNPGEAAVKHILEYLLRLVPAAAAATDEPSEPEEEGEVTICNGIASSIHFLKKLLRQALQLHPTVTLGYCLTCLAGASSSNSNSKAVDLQLLQGVRMWLKDHLLRESTPSRESTPLGDSRATAGCLGTVADGINGGHKAAVKGCCLKHVLDASQELQAWVMQQARGRAAAPAEVRAILETFLQLLPPHAQLAAAKPKLDPPAALNRYHQQQQQRLSSALSLPNMRHREQQLVNGAAQFVNGMEPLGRTFSTPNNADRRSSRSQSQVTTAAADGQPQQQHQQQQPAHTFRSPPGFPQPPGPICLVEPCLLAYNLPPDISRHDIQQALGAEEVWLMEQQHGSSGGGSACCTFKSVLDAARVYLKHNGTARFGPGTPPVTLMFADSLPANSKKLAAAAAEASNYVWATRDAVGDAESISEDLKTAGLRLDHVHRVNNTADPGTLLKAPSGQYAASVVKYLLKKHPQAHYKAAAANAAEAAQQQESLPPLPSEPPPPTAAADWTAATGASRQHSERMSAQQGHLQQQQGMPPLPPGPPPSWGQQQQQLERVASAGSLGRAVSPGMTSGALVQQQQPGYGESVGGQGFGKHRSPANAWSGSPADWQQQQHHQIPASRDLQQPGHRWGSSAGATMQQQHMWQGRGPIPPNAVIPGPAPPPGPPPLPPGQAVLSMGASPGAAGSSSWHTASPGHTPGHTPHQHVPAPVVSPGQPPLPHNLGRGPPIHGLQQRQQGPPHIAGPRPPPNPPWGSGLGLAMSGPASAGTPRTPGPTPGRVLWQGSIVKQSVRICGVVCAAPAVPGHHAMTGYGPEPQHWPDQLHVNFRICVPDAVEQYMQASPEQRAIRLLLPQSPEADLQQLQQFINYLNGKERAGMVKLPAMRDQGLSARAVYLVVPKPQVCQQLQILWDGRDVMLIAVVVPQPGSIATPASAGLGTSSRSYRS